MEQNIFEKASREKLRFSTTKGDISVEQLWDLPLQAERGLSLDTIAQATNRALKALSEESFVTTSANPKRAGYELALDIVKHVIAVRLEENAKKRTDAERSAEREKLRQALRSKQDQKLEGLSEDEIVARLKELDG